MTNCHIFIVLYYKAGYLSETFERHTIKCSKDKRTNNDLQNTTQKAKD